jgi:hypothetical protein
MTQSVLSAPGRSTVAKRVVALHYPSAYAPPVGVWWWDEASGAIRHHYLAGHADISDAVAADLADVATASQWQARVAQLGQRASTSEDKVRPLTTSVRSPVDALLTTISHWALRW